MPYKIAVVGQKGGVSKSTIARALATAFTKENWDCLLVDLDTQQQTAFEWSRDRAELKDVRSVEAAVFRTKTSADKASENRDAVIYDGKPFADELSKMLALDSHMTVVPTGPSKDDLKPTLKFVDWLISKGVDQKRIVMIVNRGSSETQSKSAIETIQSWGFKCVSTAIANMPSYEIALDAGKCITETPSKGPRKNARAAIDDLMTKFSEIVKNDI